MTLLFIGGVFSSYCLFSQDTIRIIGSDFPPYTIAEGYLIPEGYYNNHYVTEHLGHGIDIDILIEALERTGLSYTLRFVPYKRLQYEMENNQADVAAGLFYSEDTMGNPKWNYVLYDIGGSTVFFKKRTSPIIIRSIEDLADLTIGVVRGDYYGQDFEEAQINGFIKEDNLVVATDDNQNFVKLMGNRIDLVAINNIVGPYIVREKELNDEVIMQPFQLNYGADPEEDGIYMAFGWYIDYRIVNRIRATVEQMIDDGTITLIKMQYGVSSDNESLDS